ncbi:DUF6477 family protein [Pseudooceanicola algae]|uniref:Uncharacterized protein n=1 Tax=Pseudooceanicola algae TaxID=1537215 RepID=A0A418SEJ4_9RHOB|nr:DUF6477 family protein [Pseudooceanicola algae]QPM89784.1 hypothetical protein PSAL_010100 [Pseudooceanicola algae]
MQDIQSMLAKLRRPRMLIRAARIAADGYRREVHLSAVLGQSVLPRHGAAAMHLMDREAELNRLRRDGCTTYSPSQHVSVLCALIGEARLMQG